MNRQIALVIVFALLLFTTVLRINAQQTFVEIKDDKFYSLQNDAMLIKFEKIDNKLILSNLSNARKQWVTSETTDNDLLWQLTFITDKRRSYVCNSQMINLKKVEEFDGDKKGLRFQWEFGSNQSVGYVNVTVGLNNQTKLSEWDLKVEMPEGWEVTDVIFPVLTINKDKGMQLITPSGWGAEYELDNIPTLRLPLIYPSSRATVQLMCLKEKDETLYFSTHDKDANLKTFSARIDKTIELSVDITASREWNKDRQFSFPWTTSIGLSDKGWENAVLDWYRPFAMQTIWGKKSLIEKNIPKWLLDTDLWLHGGRDGDDEYEVLKKSFDFFGNNISWHWYYWSSKDFDTNYPEYMPSREKYDRIVDLVHKKKSHIMPYTNGRLWDTTTVIYKKMHGIDEVVLKKNKEAYVETYASKAPLAVACPSSLVWNDIVIDFTKEILSEKLNSDAIYYDQVASARALPCYNENHNHSIGGGAFWHYSNREIFNNVRKYVKDNQTIATEQNAECFIDVFDLFLMGNRPMGKEWSPAPLFPLIYSDRALTYGFYLHNPNDMSFRVKNALCLLWGAQLNGGRSLFVMSNKMQENAIYLRDLMKFRNGQHDLFVGGRMLGEYTPEGDNPSLMIESWPRPSKAVRGAKWLSNKGTEVVLLANLDYNDHEIILPGGEKKFMLKAGKCIRVDL